MGETIQLGSGKKSRINYELIDPDRNVEREDRMAWDVSRQAIDAYDRANRNDPPVKQAMDRLWSRLDLDPENEGTPVKHASNTSDRNLMRILSALSRLDELARKMGLETAEPRISYEPVEGPSLPPPRLVCSLHMPNWPRRGHHTLVALGTVDRHGKARL